MKHLVHRVLLQRAVETLELLLAVVSLPGAKDLLLGRGQIAVQLAVGVLEAESSCSIGQRSQLFLQPAEINRSLSGYAHRGFQNRSGCRGRWLIKKRTRDVQQEQATFCK